jgi:hypothetical protein
MKMLEYIVITMKISAKFLAMHTNTLKRKDNKIQQQRN